MKLEKTLISLSALQTGTRTDSDTDSRVSLVLTLVYLGLMLSVPLADLTTIILFGIYPVVASMSVEGGYARIFRASLAVIPFVFFIGIFNPVFDRTPEFRAFGVDISHGWVTFVSIIVRGLFAMQALLILIHKDGFYGMCGAMRRLGVPAALTNQMMMVYRYMQVFLTELLAMQRARMARSFDGRHKLGLKMWGTMIGQLLLRTFDKARAIHNAMLARGFRGEIPTRARKVRITPTMLIVPAIWTILFLILRFTHIFPSLLIST